MCVWQLFPSGQLSSLADVLAAVSSTQAKCLLTAAFLSRAGTISSALKTSLKLRALRNDAALGGAVQAFEVDNDVNELLDTLNRLEK